MVQHGVTKKHGASDIHYHHDSPRSSAGRLTARLKAEDLEPGPGRTTQRPPTCCGPR